MRNFFWQLVYYCRSNRLKEGHYIVFVENTINPDYVSDQPETIEDVTIYTYLIWFDEEKDF